MGFVRDITYYKTVPTKRQNLMFSATFSKKKKTVSILNNPVHVEATPENINQAKRKKPN
jgi:ATP-dependent RNA helicase RhlE